MNKTHLLLLGVALLLFRAITASPAPEKSSTFIPKEAVALADRATKSFSSGDMKQAETFYQQSLKFAPNNAALHVSLAAVETRMGKLDDSENHLHEALHLDLESAPAWLLLGMNYLEQNRDSEAFAALVQATLYDDRNPRAHNYLGIASGRKGWKEASEEELRRAVELDPKYADANFNLAVFYLRRTPPLIELARRHYQQALDLGSPKDPLIEAQLAKAAPDPATSSVTH
jgi:Tfp pilus assembly protein PilF